MKASVYIKDDLWEQVQDREPEFRLSPFVQQALRDRFGGRSDRPYAKLGEIQLRNMASVRRQALAQMTAAYQFGYDIGLEFAKQLSWRAFIDFATTGWNLDAWRTGFDKMDYEIADSSDLWEEDAAYVLWDRLMEYATHYGEEDVPLDAEGLPEGLLREGFVDAIRAVWEGKSGDPDDPDGDVDTEAGDTEAGDTEAPSVEEASDADA